MSELINVVLRVYKYPVYIKRNYLKYKPNIMAQFTGFAFPPQPSPPQFPSRQRILILAFLFPNGQENPTLNKIVAKMSKYKTCHVEIVFEDDMAFSIFAGSSVFFKQRSFSNPDYSLVSLSISNTEYNSIYNFCQSIVTHNLGFTDAGMIFSYVQPKNCPFFNTAPSAQVGYTFCSKIVTEALQFAETPEVEHLIPCTTTPSCLYEVFKDSPRKILSSVSYKQEQLRHAGVIRV
jgi:hypothetical protein